MSSIESLEQALKNLNITINYIQKEDFKKASEFLISFLDDYESTNASPKYDFAIAVALHRLDTEILNSNNRFKLNSIFQNLNTTYVRSQVIVTSLKLILKYKGKSKISDLKKLNQSFSESHYLEFLIALQLIYYGGIGISEEQSLREINEGFETLCKLQFIFFDIDESDVNKIFQTLFIKIFYSAIKEYVKTLLYFHRRSEAMQFLNVYTNDPIIRLCSTTSLKIMNDRTDLEISERYFQSILKDMDDKNKKQAESIDLKILLGLSISILGNICITATRFSAIELQLTLLFMAALASVFIYVLKNKNKRWLVTSLILLSISIYSTYFISVRKNTEIIFKNSSKSSVNFPEPSSQISTPLPEKSLSTVPSNHFLDSDIKSSNLSTNNPSN